MRRGLAFPAMEIAIVYLGLAIAVGVGADNWRNRNGFGWFLLALVISPLVAGLLMLALRPVEKRQSKPAEVFTPRWVTNTPDPIVKSCPDCAEEVKYEAKVCRFCRHEFA